MKNFLPFVLALFFSASLFAQTDLIISEYVEGWSNNKAIEIYNPTSNDINLGLYRLTRYSNGDDTPANIGPENSVILPDFDLEPYRTYVCVLDKRNPAGEGNEAPVWQQLQDRADVFLCPDYNESKALYHNGNDAVGLEKKNGSKWEFVDLFAAWGFKCAEATMVSGDPKECWTNTFPYDDGQGIGITAEHTLVRKSNIAKGVTENPEFFNPLEQWDSLSANSFYKLGWHKFDGAPQNETPEFEQESYEFKVWKQAQNGKVVGTIKATDKENNSLRYFINANNYFYVGSGSNATRHEPFELNKTTGEMTLVDAAALTSSPWDTLFIKVSVNDGFSETDWITVKTIFTDTDTGIDQIGLPSNFTAYPNPVSGNELTIQSAKAFNQVNVINIAGQVLESRNIVAENRLKLSTKSFEPGLYFVEVQFNDQTKSTRRVVVK